MRPADDPVALEKDGVSPVTYAVQDGRIAAAWVNERTRAFPAAVGGYAASAEARSTDPASYAADARGTGPPGPDILNFDGSSLSAAQSGLPAE